MTVLKQGWEIPQLDEALALAIPSGQLALVREVILYGNNQPWVYARSVLPHQALNGRLRFLRRLGNKPLGALLFSNPVIKREPVVLQRYSVMASRAFWYPKCFCQRSLIPLCSLHKCDPLVNILA